SLMAGHPTPLAFAPLRRATLPLQGRVGARLFVSAILIRCAPRNRGQHHHGMIGASRTGLPPSRAICSALMMHRSLGGSPHRSRCSQSPQVNSSSRENLAIAPANLSNIARAASNVRMVPSQLRHDETESALLLTLRLEPAQRRHGVEHDGVGAVFLPGDA